MILSGVYVGQFVDVLEFIGTAIGASHTGLVCTTVDAWEVSAPRNQKPHPGANLDSFIAQDHMLLPIRPGDLDESEETEKTLEFTE
jgi:hypothetical protein